MWLAVCAVSLLVLFVLCVCAFVVFVCLFDCLFACLFSEWFGMSACMLVGLNVCVFALFGSLCCVLACFSLVTWCDCVVGACGLLCLVVHVHLVCFVVVFGLQICFLGHLVVCLSVCACMCLCVW